MGKYAACPGGCSAVVKIWPGNKINFCCLYCWRWTWENGTLGEIPLDNVGEVIDAHSAMCYQRQEARAGIAPTPGEYELMSPPAGARVQQAKN